MLARTIASRGLRIAGCALLFVASACAALADPRPTRAPATAVLPAAEPRGPPAARRQWPAVMAQENRVPFDWKPGQVLLHGYLGATYLSEFSLESGTGPTTELEDDFYEVLPSLGGGAQLKLAGDQLDFGLEGLLAFAGRPDLQAFASSGGTTVAVFDVSLLLIDLYGGPFVSRSMGDSARLYAGAGPVLQWISYDQDDRATGESEDDDGFGGGFYARGGLEFLLPSGKLIGMGVRWSETSIGLGQALGDLDMSGTEVFFSLSYGFQPRSPFYLE